MRKTISGDDGGRDPDVTGRVVGKDTFGEPIYENDSSTEIGRDTFNEPITTYDRAKARKEQRERDSSPMKW